MKIESCRGHRKIVGLGKCMSKFREQVTVRLMSRWSMEAIEKVMGLGSWALGHTQVDLSCLGKQTGSHLCSTYCCSVLLSNRNYSNFCHVSGIF